MLLITRSKSYLFLDARYPASSQESLTAAELEVVKVAQGEKKLKALCNFAAAQNIADLHLERSHLNYAEFLFLKKELPVEVRVYGDDWISEQRQLKTAAEVAQITEATDQVLELFEQAENWLEEGISEKQLNRQLRAELESRGEERAFYPLVLFGERTAAPHAPPSERKLTDGDAVLLDLGLRLNGYCTDLTRMFFRGENQEVQELYELSSAVARKICERIRPGCEVKKLANFSDKLIEEAGFSQENILHGVGHGLGLEIHESPSLSRHVDARLKEGMVVTVEPGIYVPGVGGGRIEHVLHVTEEGAQILDDGG